MANSPWSGWYDVPDIVWMVAHTTQFVQPGWMFSDSNGTKLAADAQGSVVSYVSPDGNHLSIVIETARSNQSNTFEIQLTGKFAELSTLYMWKSRRGDVFANDTLLALTQGAASVTLEPQMVMTLSTTSGQSKGGLQDPIPVRANFSLPWNEDFESYSDDHTPRFTSDLHGVFSVRDLQQGEGRVLEQRSLLPPLSTHAGTSSVYATTIGDASWLDYQVSITARLLSTQMDSAATTAPFLFVASHIGAFEDGCSCILSGEKLPETCSESGCCPVGKGGLDPSTIHKTLNPAGFVLKFVFNPSNQHNTSWMLQAGRHGPSDKCDGRGCATVQVASGILEWEMGEWAVIKLSAKRQPQGKTLLRWSVQPVAKGVAVAVREFQAEVDTVVEARAGVAWGNSMYPPVSQWDNLTIVELS